MVYLNGGAFLVAFAILFMCAGLFVDGASRIATIPSSPFARQDAPMVMSLPHAP